jgi:uncharacterized coiled-coil DUF342 family protein
MLGAEAAESMIDWLDELDEHRDVHRLEVRADIAEVRQELRADIAEVRQELRAEIAELRQEMRAGFAAVDARFAGVYAKLGELREEMRVGFAAVDAKIEQRNAQLMKWMIGFWVGSFAGIVGAILALGHIR